MIPRLDGKVALITGTGGGQGRAAAQYFARAGAHVVGCDINADSNRETAGLVRASGGRITTMSPVNLGNRQDAQNWVDLAAAIEGRIDVLYNNAAAMRVGAIDVVSYEDWDFTMRNEIDLVFTVIKRAWRHLQREGGVIINIASIAATHSPKAVSATAHNTAKGAIVSLSRALAVEGGPHNIRVVCISPGIIETPVTASALTKEGMREMWLGRNLLQRIGEPKDVAAAALFLASDYASFITGINLVVDGGFTAS
jgi:NAD(P)-dependent dehydrogenase (short-subunit alcohol dehydrogenase family)